MAAKPSYKVPYGLNETYLDVEIALQNKDGSIGKVVPVKALLFYFGSAALCMFLVMRTFIGTVSTMPQKVIFCLLWAIMTFLLGAYDGTRRMNMQRIPSLMAYIPKSARYVYTRSTKPATDFYGISNIDAIRDDGMVTFNDGTYGFFYRVVGSASILLFDSDKDAIIDRVNNFYKKWAVESEIIFITCKESQKVYRQVANLKLRYDNLKNDDEDLREIAEEQFKILRNYVGKEFKSIHQYMVVKSNNKEALRVANNTLQGEVENSSLMIKQCVPLDSEDLNQILSSVFQKNED